MRIAALVLLAVLVSPASAQTTGTQAHSFDEAGFTITLPDGFVLEQSLTERLPDFGVFLFIDEAIGSVAVEVHTYFGPDQRAAFLRGESATQELSHLPGVKPADASAYGLAAGAAFQFGDETYRGVVLYGCEEARCYKVSATSAAEATLASLLEGVAFGG